VVEGMGLPLPEDLQGRGQGRPPGPDPGRRAGEEGGEGGLPPPRGSLGASIIVRVALGGRTSAPPRGKSGGREFFPPGGGGYYQLYQEFKSLQGTLSEFERLNS